MSTLRSEITQYAGISNAASVPILVTETNSSIDMDTQPGAVCRRYRVRERLTHARQRFH